MTAPSWRWRLLLSVLAGGKPPELPAFGEVRRYVARDEPMTGDERAELLADLTVSATEAALLLGLSRQRVFVLRRALHPRGGSESLQP